MNNKHVNFILDNYKGIRRDRCLKIEAGQLKDSDKEFKKHLLNELILYRRAVIKDYKRIETLKGYKGINDKNYKHFESMGDIVGAAEEHLKAVDINNLIKGYRELIAGYGGLFMSILKSNLLSEHEICQIFNVNHKTWSDKKKRYIQMFGIAGGQELNYHVTTVMVVEYRHKQGRSKEFYDCPDYEMPVYWAIHEYIKQKMKDNKVFNEAIDKTFNELFPGAKGYNVIEDLEGNIKGYLKNK